MCRVRRESSGTPTSSVELPAEKGLWSQQLKVAGGGSVIARVLPEWSVRKVSFTPFQGGGYSGIYQGLNYAARASFNQLQFHSRHTAVPAAPTAQDFSQPCCLCVQRLTEVTKSVFVLVTWGIQKREADTPYIC